MVWSAVVYEVPASSGKSSEVTSLCGWMVDGNTEEFANEYLTGMPEYCRVPVVGKTERKALLWCLVFRSALNCLRG